MMTLPPAWQLRLSDWKKVFAETLRAIGDKNLGVLAAGIAYFATLSFFPLMMALVSISALFIPADRLHEIVATINIYLPKDIASLINAQLTNLVDKPAVSMTALVVGLAIALWGIAGAVENLVRALNAAYDVRETRSFLRIKRLSFGLTAGVIMLFLVTLPMMAVTESWLAELGVASVLISLFSIVRWLVLLIIMMAALSFLYYYAPNRSRPRWRWLSWGAIVATGLWLLVTAAFFVYARYFAHFSDSYSLFAGIIVLMTWCNVSAMAFLIGATVNHQLESRH